ncbi:enoyl-CoA hydratase/isomerase family protein [Microbacterium sp. SORGH_AS_0888]|uniref:enoyl-CoA hydratase/isomerase family protein n=1 Tax=Microbacterium sp. SORGH_AS_0888 TaxID=3041791 RepID=UPI00278654A0|nr:enoyl-CoA hydratase/isomerase family protein [Microbacterium sp. SORGH_AS_0888]MDQ1128092.1 enoyl-CoA hydratase [Microbacterium sp. SORGH_AS_0888]
MNGASPDAEVLFARRGRAGIITLNRPRAINALTHAMVGLIRERLEAWRADDSVQTVVLDGAGERGLCAGGDIARLYQDATSGDGAASLAFWRDEYALDAAIARYPKPFVAIMDGLVLGGGIGLSAHASHRVVTESSRLGLPETGIGFVPDVGATWLLSRAPGELGTYLALTAGTVGAGDAIALGLADVYVPRRRLPLLVADLERSDATTALARHTVESPESELLAEHGWIDAAFGADRVAEILVRLRTGPTDDRAHKTAELIETRSPVASAVALAALRRAASLPDLESALEQEYRVSARALQTHDFVEGVRAQVIDKDRAPRWQPKDAATVDEAMVAAYFEPVSTRFPDQPPLVLGPGPSPAPASPPA